MFSQPPYAVNLSIAVTNAGILQTLATPNGGNTLRLILIHISWRYDVANTVYGYALVEDGGNNVLLSLGCVGGGNDQITIPYPGLPMSVAGVSNSPINLYCKSTANGTLLVTLIYTTDQAT